MKTRYMIAAASALLLFAGCAREMDFQKPGSTVLRAVIESGETRVSFDKMGKFSWDEGDKIAVYVGSAFEEVDVDHETGAFKVESAGDRSFYAVYPATAAPANNTALTVTIPDSYDISGISDADFSPVPMVAQNLQGQDELYFLHVGGLVRIFGENATGATTAVVTFDKDVTGTYTVDTSDPKNPTINTNGNTTNNQVTFTLPSSANFVLNVPVPCGTYQTVKIALGSDSPVQLNTTPLTFERHHGKTLVIGEVTFSYELEGLHEVIAEYRGGTKELAQSFSSYKTPDGGATKVGVPFEFEFSEDGVTGWSTANESGWLDIAPGVDYSGSTAGEPLQVTITQQQNTAVDVHQDYLRNEAPVLSDVDLSTKDMATGEPVRRTTANCYVVQAPGTYKFPLVYGNGVKNGAPNEAAWRGVNTSGEYMETDWVAGTLNETSRPFSAQHGKKAYFVDHLDRPITSPYIMTQLAGDNVQEWTVEQFVLDVSPNNVFEDWEISGSGEDAYITFKVRKEAIKQCNALVALKADGVVVWSWHIWVTDRDLKAVEGPNGYWFAPVNMGWRDTRETARYNERVWYIRVKQTEDGGITSDPLKVTSRAGDIVIESGGRGMKYQLGRKDPRPGTYLLTKGNATPVATTNSFNATASGYKTSQTSLFPDITDDLGTYTSTVNHTIGVGIQNPRVSLSATRFHALYNVNWSNLWDSSLTSQASNTTSVATSTKTIYDPCPVGYKVPTYAYYEGFDDTNLLPAEVDGVSGRKYGDDLFFPYVPATTLNMEIARYGTAHHAAWASWRLFDFYSSYVFGQTSEALSGSYTVRAGKE